MITKEQWVSKFTNRPKYENCTLLGYYTASTWPLKMGPIGFPEMLVWNYHHLLRYNPGECSSHLLCSRNLKSRRLKYGHEPPNVLKTKRDWLAKQESRSMTMTHDSDLILQASSFSRSPPWCSCEQPCHPHTSYHRHYIACITKYTLSQVQHTAECPSRQKFSQHCN